MKTYVNDYCRVKVKTQAVRGVIGPTQKRLLGMLRAL